MTLPADPNQPITVVSYRVSEIDPRDTAPGSIQMACGRCSEPVWVAPQIRHDAQGDKLEAICVVCFRADPASFQLLPVLSPATREYLKGSLNLNNQEMDELLEEEVDHVKFG